MTVKRKQELLDVSVILTDYNGASYLRQNIETVNKVLLDTRFKWEIILYDDASSDDSPKIFREFAKGQKNIRYYSNKINIGRGGCVKKAIRKSKGKIVGYIDTDLELSPVYIPQFVREIREGADVAIGKRIYTVGPINFIRTILSRGYIYLARLLLDLDLTDTEAGFKFFNRKKILPLMSKVKDDRWFFDTEIVSRSVWKGLVVKEVPVLYVYNPDKPSSVKLVSDTLEYFRKLFILWKERER